MRDPQRFDASRRIARSRGFTLIEILVAVLLLSTAVLGLIGLESLALKNNSGAYYRSQATILAYNLADKMRVNIEGDYIDGYVNAAAHTKCTSYTGDVVAGGCTEQQRAERDAWEWLAQVANTLPLGSASLAKTSASGVDLWTVKLSWDDDRNGVGDETMEVSFVVR